MLKNEAAITIQGFFKTYRREKQKALHQIISKSSNSRLLEAIHLRFQCMRAVAAAKFPLNKPLEDKAQIMQVLNGVTMLAKAKGITNLEAVAEAFQHNIMLSTMIQVPYYDLIWRKSHQGERDIQKLINHAYTQLQHLVLSFNLTIDCFQEKSSYTPAEVLTLARKIIQHASIRIIEILAIPTHQESRAISQAEFAEIIEEMLSNYMTPTMLASCQEAILLFAQKMTESPPFPQPKF